MDIKIERNVLRGFSTRGIVEIFSYQKNDCMITNTYKEGTHILAAYVKRSEFVDKYLTSSPHFSKDGKYVIYDEGYKVPLDEIYEATDKLKDKIQKEIDRAKKLEREEKYR